MPDEIIEEKPVETPVPASTGGDEFQMPEKFQGKSAEEIAKSTVELERKLTELTANDGSKAEIAKLTEQITKLQEAILSKNQPPVEEDVAAQNTKKYLNDLGYVNKDDLAKAQEQGRKDYELSRINADLVNKYDGKEGKVPVIFNPQEIAIYAKEKGYERLHPETVFKLKYEAELRDWDIKQALKGNRAPSVPGQGKGSQQPAGPDLSKMKPEEAEAIAKENALKRIQAQESV
jgi:hypothetical protein